MTESIRLETTTGVFHALSFGRGPSLLLLHGFPDSPHGQAPLAQALARSGYRVVVPWLRGYAPSTLAGPFNADQLGADAVALADAVGASLIAGHDWGAVAVHRACALAPSRFERAITMSLPHPIAFLTYLALRPRQWVRSWYMFCFQLPGVSEWLLARSGFALVGRLWRTWSPALSVPPHVLQEGKRCLAEDLRGPIGYYRSMLRPIGEALTRVRRVAREKIATPTLHLHGANDGCIAPAACVGQERYFSGPFDFELIEGVGHFLGLEQPEAVASRIARWIEPATPAKRVEPWGAHPSGAKRLKGT